ncbi:hypothetical protein Pcinc_019583 [Petrolisthes cinctipes]|uniref:Uncharacterized protein n=1 Tax=Petrolisthes cinctipes TaxID=88211 RepID=A0AAE1FJX1_PETCI|nr:hypothetical protein Pcinc_019583 [Petrolisthes cinctipes]
MCDVPLGLLVGLQAMKVGLDMLGRFCKQYVQLLGTVCSDGAMLLLLLIQDSRHQNGTVDIEDRYIGLHY